MLPSADQFEALADEARRTNSSALVILQDNEPLVHQILDDGGNRPIETMSVTKAIVSLLVGRAVTLGLIPNVDVAVSEYFPEWRQGRKRDVTLRHLLTHTSGLQNTLMAGTEIYPSADFVQLALCAEFDHAPGTVFAYNNKAVNLIMGLLERAVGHTADEFARSELFAPLGIHAWQWDRDARGNPHGMSGLKLQPLDLARLGQLALNEGRHGDAVLIDSEWIRQSTRPATSLTESIGFLWWTLPAWTHYRVADEHVRNLIEVGAADEQVRALRGTVGEYASRTALITQLNVTGLVPPDLPAGVTWMTPTTGPLVGFRHDGSLGQHLVVHREARLVAVRLIDWQHPRSQERESSFSAFIDRVLDVAGTAANPVADSLP